MKCQRTACGRDIPEDALYCPYCGKKQQRTAAPKPRKRANGRGSVYRRGRTWIAQVRVVRAGVVLHPHGCAAALHAADRLLDSPAGHKKMAGTEQGQAQSL